MEEKKLRESWTSVLLPVTLILGLVLLLSLNVGHQAGGEGMPSNALEPWLKLFASYLVAGTEIAAALVIGIAALRGIVAYLGQLVRPSNPQPDSIESIRLRLGRVLALGLEFTIAQRHLAHGRGAYPARHYEPRRYRAVANVAELLPGTRDSSGRRTSVSRQSDFLIRTSFRNRTIQPNVEEGNGS